MVHGQINAYESWPEGYVCLNRRMMYAALEWSTQNYTMFIDQLRELCGGSVFQLPADISVLDDTHLAQQFMTYFQTPQADAVSRRSEEHTSELQSHSDLVCRLLL